MLKRERGRESGREGWREKEGRGRRREGDGRTYIVDEGRERGENIDEGREREEEKERGERKGRDVYSISVKQIKRGF